MQNEDQISISQNDLSNIESEIYNLLLESKGTQRTTRSICAFLVNKKLILSEPKIRKENVKVKCLGGVTNATVEFKCYEPRDFSLYETDLLLEKLEKKKTC